MADGFPVTLISPDGTPYDARSPVEANSLIYGHGYKARDPQELERALNNPVAPSWSGGSTKNAKKTAGE